MTSEHDEPNAFSSFRALGGGGNSAEREDLFRNMAQLFTYVSDRCNDEQVAQYDEVLCRLADLVEVEARSHVAQLLSTLKRAPGTVVVKLANDDIEVAAPLLAFSGVLNDDDLIEIVAQRSEAHRLAIAGRENVAERVGDAIVTHGEPGSVTRLVRNSGARIGEAALERLVALAERDETLAADLRGRAEIDWKLLRGEIDSVAGKVLETLGEAHKRVDPVSARKVNAVVYNRLRNGAGFNAADWQVALNQVRALSDRRQLDARALARFARFGYGHHAAASIAVQLGIDPEIVVRWLALQDYPAVTVALKVLDLSPDLFAALMPILPWRDLPTETDRRQTALRFEALDHEEADEIFGLWRSHAFRRRPATERISA